MSIFKNKNILKELDDNDMPKRIVSQKSMVQNMTVKEYYNYRLKEALREDKDYIVVMPVEMYEAFYLNGFINDPTIGGRQINVLDENLNPFY